MGRQSSLDKLSPEVRERLHALLNDPRSTIDSITQAINEYQAQVGDDLTISRSAVGRYSRHMAKVVEKVRQSREISNMWIAKLGEMPTTDIGPVLCEFVRLMAFDTVSHLSDGEDPIEPRMLKDLAASIRDLEKAASDNEKRAADILKRERERAAAKLDELADKTKTGKAGFDAETLRRVREEIYGLA